MNRPAIDQSIKDEGWRASALIWIAVAQAKAGLPKGAAAAFGLALQAAQGCKNEVGRAISLSDIAQAEADRFPATRCKIEPVGVDMACSRCETLWGNS